VVWTPAVVFRVTTISVLMLLTLVGNISLISVIASQASLRRKRVSVFLLNLVKRTPITHADVTGNPTHLPITTS